MHRIGTALLVWGLLAGAPVTPEASPQITTLPVAEGGEVQAVFDVHAPLAVARDVLWDTRHFPEFMPDTDYVHVLSEKPDEQVDDMGGSHGPFKASYVAERQLFPDKITWHALSGAVKVNDGFWAFQAIPGGTRLTYRVHLVPKLPAPGFVVAYLQRQALPAMIQAVRTRIEAQAKAEARPG
ncbi:MAG TPA: SRPBCC family protein [Oscillatoriaceae cyanobacterium]